MNTRFALCLAGISLVFGCAIAAGEPPANVALLPFAAETTIPITTDSVECAAHEYWVIPYEKLESLFVNDLAGDEFENKRVRAAVSVSATTLYIDKRGRIQGYSSQARVDPRQFVIALEKFGTKRPQGWKPPKCK